MESNRLDDLRKALRDEEERIRKCNHSFGEAYYNPETTKELTYKMVAHGSDIGYDIDGSKEVTKDRWSRKCLVCGLVDHAYNKKPVISEYIPDFKNKIL